MDNVQPTAPQPATPTQPDPEDIDWYATGVRFLAEQGNHAVDFAAAILQNALTVLLRESIPRVILNAETKKSPRRLALQALGAFETAGGIYTAMRAAMPPEKQEAFDKALREHARDYIAAATKKPPAPSST